jgi:hypothetical protein
MKWSNNSCAYDSIFTIFFSIWSEDQSKWSQHFYNMGNEFMKLLNKGFKLYEKKEKSLEQIRDKARHKLHNHKPETMGYGQYTSLEHVLTALMKVNQIVYRSFYNCANDHQHFINTRDTCLELAAHRLGSTQVWATQNNELNEGQSCPNCNEQRYTQTEMVYIAPIIAFEFSGEHIDIDQSFTIQQNNFSYNYSLAGIIYFGQAHFTARIIKSDGQIWYYDGMTNNGNMIYDGSLLNNCPDLSRAQSKVASAAIYVLME